MSPIETTTVSEAGFQHRSRFGEYELLIDAVGDVGPGARDALLATYASCFQGECRVGAQQRGYDDLGKLRTDAVAELDDEDHFASIQFSMLVEEDLDSGAFGEVLHRARDICHVHNALGDDLKADIEIHGHAF